MTIIHRYSDLEVRRKQNWWSGEFQLMCNCNIEPTYTRGNTTRRVSYSYTWCKQNSV